RRRDRARPAAHRVDDAHPAHRVDDAHPARRPQRRRRRMRRPVLIAVAVLLLALPLCLRAFVIEAFKVSAGSMIPTLQVGDHIFVDKMATHPKRGDVIVFRYPKEPDKDFIKRVIAVGGDTIGWQGESLILNGTLVARKPIEGECRYFDYRVENQHW